MFDKIIAKLLTRSALRVIFSLLVGLFIGLKIPEGAEITCTIADILQVEVEACE